MTSVRVRALAGCGAAVLLAVSCVAESRPSLVRVASYNIKELGRDKLDRLDATGRGADPQLVAAAEILQRLNADVVLINEIDFDERRENARLFVERYLAVSQNGQPPLDYEHIYFAPVNTGVPTGLDLSGDGTPDGPDDAYGFGRYPGQYGMALLSHYPIDAAAARTFQLLRWRDVPAHLMPDGEDGRPEWYSPEAAELMRISSKSHWDVPVVVGERRVHVLASHPTPTVFDGEEDRNGRRNHDEIRLWVDYLSGGEEAAYLVDDQGGRGGLAAGESFVILGDLNLDPLRAGDAYGPAAIVGLLEHPRVQDPGQQSAGGPHAERDGESKERWSSPWGRIDYALPSADLEVSGSGVWWPAPGDPLAELAAAASDHRAVWVDLEID